MDVGYYAPTARTTLTPRVFLCSCSLGRPAESLSASPSTHPLGLDGCTTSPGCGSPQTTTYEIYFRKCADVKEIILYMNTVISRYYNFFSTDDLFLSKGWSKTDGSSYLLAVYTRVVTASTRSLNLTRRTYSSG